MTGLQILINVIGIALIAWIVWYFWLWKRESVAAAEGSGGMLEVDVTVRGGYQPASITVKAGRPLRLNFIRRESTPCGEEVLLPDFGKRAYLPENEKVPIEVVPPAPGEYEFTCGMNMYKGKLIAE
jgi:plastocyanin domain-containing protein